MNRLLILLTIFSFAVSSQTLQAQPKPTDYLGVKAGLRFQQDVFSLAWSSHPTENYYKHEYLQAGDSVQHFKKMLLLEVLTGESNMDAIVGAKMNELKESKATNSKVEYNLYSNKKTGEYLIDFVLTADGTTENTAIAERNVYRYKKITTAGGKAGVLLFGVSCRSYGTNIASFLAQIKTDQKMLVNAVARFEVPTVKF